MSTDLVAYAIYPDRTSFEAALDALRAAGFRNSDVSAILPERDRTAKDLAHEINTKVPEGAAAGAGTGAAVGGVLGWLVGIGALAIPGVGPLVAAGPIVAALAGAGAGGATGGLVGGLIGAGIPEVEAKRYAGRVREGGYRSPSIATTARGAGAQRRFSKPRAATMSLARRRRHRTIVPDPRSNGRRGDRPRRPPFDHHRHPEPRTKRSDAPRRDVSRALGRDRRPLNELEADRSGRQAARRGDAEFLSATRLPDRGVGERRHDRITPGVRVQIVFADILAELPVSIDHR